MKKPSGLADSPFFAPAPVKREEQPVFPEPAPEPPAPEVTVVPRYHDTTVDFLKSRVAEIGKEAATYRFTPREKQALSKLVYVYKGQGIKTSENEILRVALNYVLHEHQQGSDKSLLAAILKALHS